MKNKGKYKQYRFENNLDRGADKDPDFDLDEYIRQQSMKQSQSADLHIPDEVENSQFKNAVLFFLVFAAAFLWVNDWSPTQAWGSIFGTNEANVTTTAPPAPTFEIPDIPDIPPVPNLENIQGTSNNSGFIDYMRQINEAELADIYSNQAYVAFYQSDVPVEFISDINEAGYLEQLSFTDLIIMYETGGTIDYLDAMQEAGYFEKFSIRTLLILQSAGVPLDFIRELDENGLLEDMSYTDIIVAYNADN